ARNVCMTPLAPGPAGTERRLAGSHHDDVLERPTLPALVELHVLEALAPTGLAEPEVELAHVIVAAEPVGRTVEDDPAVFHDVAVIRNAESDLGVLLDEEERRPPLVVDPANDVEDLAHEQGRETE